MCVEYGEDLWQRAAARKQKQRLRTAKQRAKQPNRRQPEDWRILDYTKYEGVEGSPQDLAGTWEILGGTFALFPKADLLAHGGFSEGGSIIRFFSVQQGSTPGLCLSRTSGRTEGHANMKKIGPVFALLLGCTLEQKSAVAFQNSRTLRAPHHGYSLSISRTHIMHGALFAQSADAAQSTGESSQGTVNEFQYSFFEIFCSSVVAYTSVSGEASAALQTIGDWECYLDESKGLVYYHNRITGKSQWEQPEDVAFDNVHRSIPLSKKVEMRNRLKSYLEERLIDSSTDFIGTLQDDRKDAQWKRSEAQMKLEDRKNSQAGDVVAEWNQWQALIDKRRGRIYYFDKIARTSTWDRPKGFADFKLSPSQEAMMEEQRRRFDEWQSTNSEARVSVLGKGTIGASSKKTKGKPASFPIVQQGEWGAYFDVKSGE